MKYLVLGQGKSGTTALFRAIEAHLGPSTKTIFEPKDLGRLDSSGPKDVVAKVLIEHVEPDAVRHLRRFDKKIFICRDPRDVMVSRLLYRVRDMDFVHDPKKRDHFIHLIKQKESDPAQISAARLFEELADISGTRSQLVHLERVHKWAVELWEQVGHDFFLLRYEDFVDGRVTDLNHYLGMVIDPGIDVGPEFGRVSRTKSHGDWKNWLVADELDAAQKMFHRYMDTFGYDDWELSREPTIDSDVASAYLQRIIDEKLSDEARSGPSG